MFAGNVSGSFWLEQPVKTLLLIVISAKEHSFWGFFLYFYVVFLHNECLRYLHLVVCMGELSAFLWFLKTQLLFCNFFLSS